MKWNSIAKRPLPYGRKPGYVLVTDGEFAWIGETLGPNYVFIRDLLGCKKITHWAALPSLPRYGSGGWHSVSQPPPSDGREVLVTDGAYMSIGETYLPGAILCGLPGKATHWMPLPRVQRQNFILGE